MHFKLHDIQSDEYDEDFIILNVNEHTLIIWIQAVLHASGPWTHRCLVKRPKFFCMKY